MIQVIIAPLLLFLLQVKIYYKITVIKTVLYWYKKKTNRSIYYSPEIDLNTYKQMTIQN